MPLKTPEHNAAPNLAAPAAMESVRQDGSGVLISVRAKPRSHADSIGPESGGAWAVSVRATPSDGEANAAVVNLVARALGRAASTCSLHRGHRSRDKLVRAEGIDAESALQKLHAAASEGVRGSRGKAGRAKISHDDA